MGEGDCGESHDSKGFKTYVYMVGLRGYRRVKSPELEEPRERNSCQVIADDVCVLSRPLRKAWESDRHELVELTWARLDDLGG